MDHLEFLFAGFAVFWAGLLVYLLLLQARLRGLSREIERLEERLSESASPGDAVAPGSRGPGDEGPGDVGPGDGGPGDGGAAEDGP